MCHSFATKYLKNDKTEFMFPLRSEEHIMKLRNEEALNVNHANTERYLKSSIPYMQRLINSDYKMNPNEKIRTSTRMPG